MLSPDARHVSRLLDGDVEAVLPQIVCVAETAAALGIDVHGAGRRFGNRQNGCGEEEGERQQKVSKHCGHP